MNKIVNLKTKYEVLNFIKNGGSLKYVYPCFKSDKDIVIEAIKLDKESFQYASKY